ncbi:penicillin-binding protein 1A [Zobellella taiwanensis]|uniref:penicillin-binding protein 1A n=1 Tax=Zobellella taiwanensis TaxID=347535 RepID=UPI002681AFF1
MLKWLVRLLSFVLFLGICGLVAVFVLYQQIRAELPDVSTLKEVRLEIPMRVFSQDGELISQYGEQRRNPVTIDAMPPLLIDAFLATEDARFYEHPGIDPIGITRAAIIWISTGEKRQGASTITQQVARNFFLSREKTVTRKIKEIFLALHIETLLSKDEILELYLNKIPLGHRSHGVAAAAQVYYGKELAELTLAEMAMIAGLPQAPSVLNPISNPRRAGERRAIVLGRMLETGKINRSQYDEAMAAPVAARYHGAEITLNAPYLAEMAHQFALSLYGDEAYTRGLNIYTTVQANEQHAANQALINGLLAYDLRHGYRGAVASLWQGAPAWDGQRIREHLDEQPRYWPLEPAVVTAVAERSATVIIRDRGEAELDWDGLKWARRYIADNRQGNAPRRAADILKPGEQIWVRPQGEGWMLGQLPGINGALVALEPASGAVTALVGGFNFTLNKFNRAEQAARQMGSNIKPFIYSAALDHGFTLASMVNDAPINHWDAGSGNAWKPRNSPNVYDGPIRVREALARSKNVVSIRLLRDTGIANAMQRLNQFGFNTADIPATESLALGSPSATPLQMATGYAAFANGGHRGYPLCGGTHRGYPGATAVPGSAGAGAGRQRGKRLPHHRSPEFRHLGRRERRTALERHRLARRPGPGAQGHRRQNGHNQRLPRCLVFRFQPRPGGHRLGWLRRLRAAPGPYRPQPQPGARAGGGRRIRWQHRLAYLERVHEGGPGSLPGAGTSGTARDRQCQYRQRQRPARQQRRHRRVFRGRH